MFTALLQIVMVIWPLNSCTLKVNNPIIHVHSSTISVHSSTVNVQSYKENILFFNSQKEGSYKSLTSVV